MRTSQSIIINKNTAMIVSLKRCVLFYLRSAGQHILVSDTNMAVFVLIIVLCDVLIDSERSCLLKVRYVLISDTIMAVLLFMFIL
jgi:hypothetical protein